MSSSKAVLSRFPKQRSSLPAVYREIYVDHYRRNRSGASAASSLAQKMETWMHKKVAEDVRDRMSPYTTLEVGAGSLNHLGYETKSTPYDIVEPFRELYDHSPSLSRVRRVFADLGDVGAARYDRIVSIATFEHLCDLPRIVARCGLLLAEKGQLRVAIPSEGTILWTLGWKLTTGIEFRLRHGLDYGILMRHEHVNTAREIGEVLRFFFQTRRQSVFGLLPAFSFYQFFECKDPHREKCERYLSSLDLIK
jgi:hypothetical protein